MAGQDLCAHLRAQWHGGTGVSAVQLQRFFKTMKIRTILGQKQFVENCI